MASVVPCILVHWVLKGFGFPWDDSSELGVNLGSLDKVLAHKTIECFDETVAQDVRVTCNGRRLDSVWGGAQFRSLAQH